ncbi:MAG: hypothetical protein DMF17_05255 [Verrucomicrobia bacterium]|nr:MAG: hypothetical protein DMF17_05255 [Verrucomicrobiota bacterium]
MTTLYRFKSGFTKVRFFSLLCLGCALFSSACAHNDDSSADSEHHRQRHRGGDRHGQSGSFDRSNAFGSPPPVPGQ